MDLVTIKNSFEPYIPIRWSVAFNDKDLNVLGGKHFPAKDITYNAVSIGNTSVPIAPGIEVQMNTTAMPITEVNITFYETAAKMVFNKFKEFAEGKHGFFDLEDNFRITITEYELDARSVKHQKNLRVAFTGDYVNSLYQDAVPYEAPLQLLVLGEE